MVMFDGLAVVIVMIVIIVFFTVGGIVLLLLFQQGETVGDRDLVIVGVDFGEGQKAMAVAAVIHEGCLQRGFNPGYLGEVDVTFEGFAIDAFEIEFFNAVAAGHHNAGFLALAGVDEHFVAHGCYSLLPHCPRAPSLRDPVPCAG